jgi:hypothetical protein
VVDRVADLIGVEPDVRAVEHPPATGNAVVELEMAVGVPGERPDACSGRRAEAVEHVGEA